MEFLSPAYSSRYSDLHGDWYARKKTPAHPSSRELWLRHRELAWDSTVRKYTPPACKGIKPITLEPWADETMTVDSSWDRIGGDKTDIQGQLLRGMMVYQADTTSRKVLKNVLRDQKDLYTLTLE